MTDHIEIADFALAHGLSIRETMCLPAIFTRVAEIAKCPRRTVVRQALYHHPELAEYIVGVARKVAKEI